jgi:hypothetical protein
MTVDDATVTNPQQEDVITAHVRTRFATSPMEFCGHDHVVTAINEVLRLEPQVVERFEPRPDVPLVLLTPSIQPSVGFVFAVVVRQVGVEQLEEGREITRVEEIERSLRHLHVLPRHRPPSIPSVEAPWKRQTTAMSRAGRLCTSSDCDAAAAVCLGPVQRLIDA